MRRHLVSIGVGVLLAGRFGRENRSVHQYFALTNDVLFACLRNYTVDIVGVAIAREISPVYNGAGRAECFGDDFHTKHTLSKAVNAQNGTVGPEFLHQNLADAVVDARAQRSAARFGRQED